MDALANMASAQALDRQLGSAEIAPQHAELPGTRFYAFKLVA